VEGQTETGGKPNLFMSLALLCDDDDDDEDSSGADKGTLGFAVG
jgi:hypothetical protein